MFLEIGGLWTVMKILLRATKKYSREFIQNKFKLTDKQIELLYETVDKPEKIGDFAATFIGKDEKIIEVQNSIIEIKNQEKEVETNSATLETKPLEIKFSKIDLYADLLEEIFYIQSIRQEPIVLEGFFNSDKVISIFNYSQHNSFKVTKYTDYIPLTSSQDVLIEKYENEEERKKMVVELREKIKYAKYKYSAYQQYKRENIKIASIYDNFIEPESRDSLSDKELEPFFYIKPNYEGIISMKKSLTDYINQILEDIKKLKDLNE